MTKYLLSRTEIDAMEEHVVQHQFNDNAIRHTRTLTAGMGLEHLGIHIVRIEPGKDSTTHHYHDADEEFIYILSGQGTAKIDTTEYPVAAGDFMAFPTGGPAHSLKNTSEEDLIYFVGGEKNMPDVVHYPEIKRSMTKDSRGRLWSDWSDTHEVPPR